jgi:DNA-binding transcriptional MerR regulator
MDYTIGEVAKRSGLTVRSLHHYEKLGLLQASARTPAGYRLYGERDILTLHRILAYQQMGLALKHIGPLLGPDAPPLSTLLMRQIGVAQAELTRQQNLLALLKRVASRASAGGAALSEQLLTLMAMRRSFERHFSEAEMQKMLSVQDALGEAGVAKIRAESAKLMPALRAEMARGAGPRSPAAKALARRWIAMSKDMPEDEALRRKARAMFAKQPALLADTGFTLELLDFLDRAVSAEKAARKART